MSCRHPSTFPQMFVDGELEGEVRPHYELHLQGCGACSAEVARLEAYKRKLLEALPEVRAPASLRNRLEAWCGRAPGATVAPLPLLRARELRA